MRRQSLLLVAPKRLVWHEETLPPPKSNEVSVVTAAGAISIGTEVPQYCGTSRPGYAPAYPKMTGYESVGVIQARGSAVRDLRVGDRVVAFYGHRTAAVVPAERVIPVPEWVSDELAVLSILGCDVMKGIRKVRPAPDEPVLVSGAGTIGLLAVWTLAALGVHQVDVVEPQPGRRELALRLGASRAWSPGDERLAQMDYAVGFECSSRDAAFHLLQSRMRAEGRICVLADGNLEPLTLAPDFHMKELSIAASSDGWDYHRHAEWYFEVVRRDSRGLERIFESHITAAELIPTFDQLCLDGARPVKVFVRYDRGQGGLVQVGQPGQGERG